VKVKQLIEELQKHNPEAKIVLYGDDPMDTLTVFAVKAHRNWHVEGSIREGDYTLEEAVELKTRLL